MSSKMSWRGRPPRLRHINIALALLVTLLWFYHPEQYSPSHILVKLDAQRSAAVYRSDIVEQLETPPEVHIDCPRLPEDKLIDMKIDMEQLGEVVRERAVDNNLIITFASSSQSLLLQNWLCSLKRQGVKNYAVIAFDQETANLTNSILGPNYAFFDDGVLGGKKVNWDRDDQDQHYVWRTIMAFKVHAVQAILQLGVNVLVTDADTVIIKNPFDGYIPTWSSCNFQFQADKKDIYQLSEYRGLKAFNCGVYYVRAGRDTLRLYDLWTEAFNCEEGSREQRSLHLALETLLEGEDYLVYDSQNEEPYMFDWQMVDLPQSTPYTMKMCYLDPKHFPNGGLFFKDVAQFRKVNKEQVPVIVHANYMKGKQERKMQHMKEKGAWFLRDDLTCPPKKMRPSGIWAWLPPWLR